MTSNVRTLLILGATSEIGGQITRLLAPGRHVVLAARRTEALKDLSAELMDVGAVSVHTEFFDASDLRSHRKIIENSGDIEHAIVCFGILGDQETAEVDEHHAANIATIDYTAQIVALTVLSDRMKRNSQPSTITAFSSIAGWRARRANYVYGSTKAGFDAFCQGLSMALHATNLRMITCSTWVCDWKNDCWNVSCAYVCDTGCRGPSCCTGDKHWKEVRHTVDTSAPHSTSPPHACGS
ncbi:short chain dehydrogenase [Corynebacterium ulcerans]|nr:short chain dehydrogenase [Corynebacterium ulcerans]